MPKSHIFLKEDDSQQQMSLRQTPAEAKHFQNQAALMVIGSLELDGSYRFLELAVRKSSSHGRSLVDSL